jgi:hypothetical protein
MRILFIEDEISKNIPRIIRLFSKYLGKDRIKLLNDLAADEWGAEPHEIKAIVEETGIIEIEHRFPESLAKIIHKHQTYALFIVDRNLSAAEYNFEEANKIDPGFTERLYEDYYFEREGDYLLHKLALLNVGVKEKFYFLTAYSAEEELRGEQDHIKHLIEHIKDFKRENIIEKGAVEKLIKIIDDTPVLQIQHQNQYYLGILRQHIGEETSEAFLTILCNKDKQDQINRNLASLRNIYQAVLECCPKKIPEMLENQNCTDKGKLVLGGKTIIWLSDNQHTNNILRNFMFSIYKITSDFGSHPGKTTHISKPTTDTVNALVYAMKDFIRWFGKLASKD